MAQCPNCSGEIEPGDGKCVHCGASLVSENVTPVQAVMHQDEPATPVQAATDQNEPAEPNRPETHSAEGNPNKWQLGPGVRPHVPLTEAILVTIFCCVPFGIVAIVMAARALCRADAGDYDGARELSRNASAWIKWGVGLGLLVLIVYFIPYAVRMQSMQ